MDATEKELFDGEPVIEFARESDRRGFLKYARIVGVGGALAMAGVACGGEDEDAPAAGASPTSEDDGEESPDGPKVPQGDLDILNYALTLEYLEADFYANGVKSKVTSGREAEIVQAIADHEEAHVGALTSTITDLGGEPVAEPTFKYPPGTFDDKAKFLATASVFEELGVKAYHGQVTEIQTPEILGAAASIAGVESRHAAVLAKLTGGKPFPSPVEGTLPMEEVLKAATPFIKS
ncbi:MAG: ferritin-like domain-containing protein [Actinobacteria bacterium]|nr:ferritin-like domain-containing protein [Actinomycetota bacterium]